MRAMRFVAAFLAACGLFVSCASAPSAPASSGSAAASAQPAPNAAKDRAKDLVQSGADAGGAAPAAAPQPAAAPAKSADQPAPPEGQLTSEEQAYLQTYLSRLNYMVFYNEDSKIDPKLAKVAVSQANRYLLEKLGLSVIDFDQIEKNKKDQQTAYEIETGGSIDLIQYLAQKLNADVYVELDFSFANEVRDSKYYASVQGSMKIYDTSTGLAPGLDRPFEPNRLQPQLGRRRGHQRHSQHRLDRDAQDDRPIQSSAHKRPGERYQVRGGDPEDARLQADQPAQKGAGEEGPGSRASLVLPRQHQAILVCLPEGR